MKQWGSKIMRHMADRMLWATKHVIAQTPEGQASDPTLSYYQMCEALRTCLPGLSEPAVYYLMVLCDRNKDGFISVSEFEESVQEARQHCQGNCAPGVLDLWD